MAEPKTIPTDQSVEQFLNDIGDEGKRRDSGTLLDLMREATQDEPRMWGSSIVGFGNSHYTYASGREGNWFRVGFSPRKQNLTVYIAGGFDQHADLMQRLGKHTTGKSCLYVKRLADVDLPTLKALIIRSVEDVPDSNP